MTGESPQDWITLETVPQLVAELWREVLEDEGLSVRIEAGDAVSFLGVSSFPCRLQVRRGDYAAAKTVLDEIAASETIDEEVAQELPED